MICIPASACTSHLGIGGTTSDSMAGRRDMGNSFTQNRFYIGISVGICLVATHSACSKVFINNIDECPEDGTRADLLGELQSLAGTLNLLVISRELSSMGRHFKGTKCLNIRATKGRIVRASRRHLFALQE
jgi:hypothetical protein